MAKSKARDDKLRSKEAWERGRGAPRKSNPNYTPKMVTDKNGNRRKVYVLRDRKGSKGGNLLSELND